MYIAGEWTSSSSGATSATLNPADGSVLRTLPEASADDVDRAVAAARAAFDTGPWPRTPAAERGRALGRIADLLQRDRESIARTESLDTGKTLKEGRLDVDDVTAV